MAARREESERRENEQMEAAHAATRKLVDEAERRAADAGKRAADAKVAAEQTRKDADGQAEVLVSRGREEAAKIVAKAEADAEKLRAQAEATAGDRREAIKRELEDMIAQRDGVAAHLAKLRQVFSGTAGLLGATGLHENVSSAIAGEQVMPRPPGPVTSTTPGATSDRW